MPVKVYFSKCDPVWDDAKLAGSLVQLPVPISIKIAAYKDPMDRQSRVQGKLLLLRLIADFGLNLSLEDMQYTTYHKPFFDGDFDFSIAHSGGMVICAATLGTKIGADIEQIKKIDLTDYRDQLTPRECLQIDPSDDKTKAFYQIWTKKEALMKVTGRGIDMDMSAIDVSGDKVILAGEEYLFHSLAIDPGYIASLAVTGTDEIIEILEVPNS